MRIILIAWLILLVACDGNVKYGTGPYTGDSTKTVKADTTMPDKAKPAVPITEPTKWNFTSETDEMTGKANDFATIEGNEMLDFKAPYGGDNKMSFMIRYKGGSNNVMLQISKGQFLTNIDDGRYVRVKFDDLPPIKYEYSNPTDYSTTTIFLENAGGFISHLKKAKKVLVETDIYNEGVVSSHFDVAGFVWKHS